MINDIDDMVLINIDDMVSAGYVLDELTRRVRALRPEVGRDSDSLNPRWVVDRRVLCDEPTTYLDDLRIGRVIYPGPVPVPLALRDRFQVRLREVLSQFRSGGAKPLVVDAWPVELHQISLPPKPNHGSIATRRLPERSSIGPNVQGKGLDDIPDPSIRNVYRQLLRQFFSHADLVTVHSLRGRTTYDVFQLTIRRGDQEEDAFAKFGPPERLEQETVNCNRLLAAAAGMGEGEDLRFRRFFGYCYLSDSNRVLVESRTDFLALFVSALHPPPVDPLSEYKFFDEPQWKTQALIGDVCDSLTLLQGRLRRLSPQESLRSDRLPYHDFHRCGRVGELSLDECQSLDHRDLVPGDGHGEATPDIPDPPSLTPKDSPKWPEFLITRAELMPSDDTGVPILRCYVRLTDDLCTIERGATGRSTIQLRQGDVIRLTLSPAGSPAYPDASGVIHDAYRSRIFAGERIRIDPTALARNLRESRVEQIRHLINGKADETRPTDVIPGEPAVASQFQFLADRDREMLIKKLAGPLKELDRIEKDREVRGKNWPIVADRIHGDLFLPNVLYHDTGNRGAIEFSFIDFEQMQYGAPAAWDYAILELSLRIHWLLHEEGPCFKYLASPEPWGFHIDRIYSRVLARATYVEQRLAFRVGRETEPPDKEMIEDRPRFDQAIHVLSLSAAAIRARYLSACQTRLPRTRAKDTSTRKMIIKDYNKTLRLAAACQALWRRPSGQRRNLNRVVVKTILMAVISSLAEKQLYYP